MTLASENIFNELTASASARRKETLVRLKAACDDIHFTGRLRLQDIERRVVDRFGKDAGPRAQTISNEKQLPLGMYHYVEARRNEAEETVRRQVGGTRHRKLRNISSSIEGIEQIDLRNLMRDVYDRLLVAEAVAARVKYILKTARPGIDVDGLISGDTHTVAPILDDRAIGILNYLRSIFTNEDKLSSCGLSAIDGNIRRKGRLADELIPASVLKGFMDLCARLDQL